MRYNYIQFNTPQFHILSDTQIEELHLATLQILERTGVAFETPLLYGGASPENST